MEPALEPSPSLSNYGGRGQGRENMPEKSKYMYRQMVKAERWVKRTTMLACMPQRKNKKFAYLAKHVAGRACLAEQLSKSRKKLHPTTYKHFFLGLHLECSYSVAA